VLFSARFGDQIYSLVAPLIDKEFDWLLQQIWSDKGEHPVMCFFCAFAICLIIIINTHYSESGDNPEPPLSRTTVPLISLYGRTEMHRAPAQVGDGGVQRLANDLLFALRQ
jgi:hypothetical protein